MFNHRVRARQAICVVRWLRCRRPAGDSPPMGCRPHIDALTICVQSGRRASLRDACISTGVHFHCSARAMALQRHLPSRSFDIAHRDSTQLLANIHRGLAAQRSAVAAPWLRLFLRLYHGIDPLRLARRWPALLRNCRPTIEAAAQTHTKTLAAHRRRTRCKILLDPLIEEAEGRPIPQEELQRVKVSIAQELRRISLTR